MNLNRHFLGRMEGEVWNKTKLNCIKKDKPKNKFELCLKKTKIDYSNLVNLETSNPDFSRNSMADSSVNAMPFLESGALNDW